MPSMTPPKAIVISAKYMKGKPGSVSTGGDEACSQRNNIIKRIKTPIKTVNPKKSETIAL
jgi:hypothetical protein